MIFWNFIFENFGEAREVGEAIPTTILGNNHVMEAKRTGQIRSILATRVQNGIVTKRGHIGSPLDYAQEHGGYGIYLDAGNPLSRLARTY